MTQTKFFKDFSFDVSNTPCSLKYLSQYYLTKALNKFFNKIESNKLITENQIIGIILRVKFNDGSIKSISTLRKGTIKNKVKFSTLFKHLLNIRSDDYDSEEIKVLSIIFSYHIYSLDYKLNDENKDLILLSSEENTGKKKKKIVT